MSDPAISMSALTTIGQVREENEDSLFIQPESRLAIVCDGMGGHSGGKVASEMAVTIVADQLLSGKYCRSRRRISGTVSAKRHFSRQRRNFAPCSKRSISDRYGDNHMRRPNDWLAGIDCPRW